MNEFIFLSYSALLALASCCALMIGKEALISFICIQTLLANLLVTKSIVLFGFTATAADALAVGSMVSLNLLQEYFGREYAQKAVWISLAGGLIYVAITQLHLAYIPSIVDVCHSHFQVLLQHTPRLITASYSTYFIIQQLEIVLYTALRRIFNGKLFLIRNIISMSITQWFDTVLFTFLGLFGVMHNLTDIIFISYIIKIITIFSMVPLIALIKQIIKP